jgi:hypothetical protein
MNVHRARRSVNLTSTNVHWYRHQLSSAFIYHVYIAIASEVATSTIRTAVSSPAEHAYSRSSLMIASHYISQDCALPDPFQRALTGVVWLFCTA